MELTISKKDFLRGLARTHGVADRKSSMPILSNVLLSTEGKGSLRLSATDLYLGVTATTSAKVSKAGTVAVSARTLFEIVKNLPEGEVRWEVKDNHLAEIRCGKVRYKIPGMPGEDFPPLPNPGDVEYADVDADLLGQLVGMTQYSMSSDDTRPHLAGALFEAGDGSIRMVTTDGHRLSKAEANLGKAGKGLEFSMLVPHKGINELKRVIEDARAERKGEEGAGTIGVATATGNAFFHREGISLSVRLADEQFPPYSKVIPQQQQRRVVAARATLIEALRRISLVASDKSGGVRLSLSDGKMQIMSENPDVGEGSEEIDVDYAGGDLTIGFNARYLIDALTALGSNEVALELSGELDPGVIKPVDSAVEFVGVIMPMRI